MCQIYSKADPIQYESRTRSLRIHGVLTTIRLENLFWEVLTEIAQRDGTTTNQLIVKLHDEVSEFRGEVGNFASFLRVCCLRHLWVQAGRDLSAATAAPAPELERAALRAVR